MALPLPAALVPADVTALFQDHAELFNQYPLYAQGAGQSVHRTEYAVIHLYAGTQYFSTEYPVLNPNPPTYAAGWPNLSSFIPHPSSLPVPTTSTF